MLTDRRYCPRCDAVSDWTNEPDGTLRLVCVGCGLTVQSELTEDESDRLARYEAKPVRGRRAYESV
jgi:ribosomal protein S27AE